MATGQKTETGANRCWVEARRVWLELADGRFVSFPATPHQRMQKFPPVIHDERSRVRG